jgi:hypothetical protein
MPRNSSVGKSCGISLIFSWMKYWMYNMPTSVLMLVYMDVASAEKSLASWGSVIPFISLMTAVEFFL